MPLKLIEIAGFVLAVSVVSALGWARERSRLALLQLCGAGLLVLMVFTHVCEMFRWLPSFGWGQPGTVGHYIDLVSASAGLALILVGYTARKLARDRMEGQ